MHSAITDKSCSYNEMQPVQKMPNEAFILKVICDISTDVSSFSLTPAVVFGFPDKQIKIEMRNKKMCFFTI